MIKLLLKRAEKRANEQYSWAKQLSKEQMLLNEIFENTYDIVQSDPDLARALLQEMSSVLIERAEEDETIATDLLKMLQDWHEELFEEENE